ncbi:MAG: phosphopantetheine-binding protein [Thermodesulfobacteriota bacterium]
MEELKKQLKEILKNDLKVQGDRVDSLENDAPLFNEGLGLDSLDAVELVVLIQKHFDVQVADMDEGMAAFSSVNSLAAYIEKKRQAQE